MRMSRASLLPAMAALMAAGVSVPDVPPPVTTGQRRRPGRRYYNPATHPAPMNLRPTPTLKKKKPAFTEDYAAIGRAVEKRARKAERRLAEQQRRGGQ